MKYDYPDFVTSTRYGEADGLGGVNCYHDFHPFIPGISERTYTDEELEEMNRRENIPVEYNGKQYTGYEALQRQRRLETAIRAKRQEVKLLQLGGAAEEDILYAKCRYQGICQEYSTFSKAMGLPMQKERINGGNAGEKLKKAVDIRADSGIIKNIELPPETNQIRSMSKETKELISKAFDDLNKDYDIRLDELVAMPLSENDKNVPFQFQPIRGENGELIKRIVINTNYDFMGSQERMQARILNNFNKHTLTSNSIEGLISHEVAHILTFQDVDTYSGYLIANKQIQKRMVYGISRYADVSFDGAECIAEAFAASRCNVEISKDAQKLVDEFIERWRK